MKCLCWRKLHRRTLCVGTLFHDDERWPDPESACYLHHLAAALAAKGAGSIFLQATECYTARQSKTWLRLDSAVGNKTLEDNYTSCGYVKVDRCADGLYAGILRQKKLG